MTTCRFCGFSSDKEVHAGTQECVCTDRCEIRHLNKEIAKLEATNEALFQALRGIRRLAFNRTADGSQNDEQLFAIHGACSEIVELLPSVEAEMEMLWAMSFFRAGDYP